MAITAIEQAKELVLRFRQIPPISPYTGVDDGEAKQCALIAVDEILEIIRYHGTDIGKHSLMFWQEVKQEIEKL